MRIGEEHMATAVIRSFLGTLTLNRNVQPSDPRTAVATPTGQRHELGALMAAVTAASEGWNAIYLGADIPADEIAAAAMQTQGRAVAISIIYPTDDGNLFYELQRLHRQLSSDVLLWTGGAGALRCRTLLKEVHAVH
jgi:methylmalonyl-CoA mutase cobalamin-binding subunit